MVHAFKKSIKTNTLTQGFSLIEIVVAIAIMAILTTLVVPQVFRYVGRAKNLKTTTSLKAIKNSVMEFQMDTGQLPANLIDLAVRPNAAAIGQRWKGPYLDEKSIEADGWGNEFIYRKNSPGSKKPYDLYSWGTNGEGSPENEWIDAWTV